MKATVWQSTELTDVWKPPSLSVPVPRLCPISMTEISTLITIRSLKDVNAFMFRRAPAVTAAAIPCSAKTSSSVKTPIASMIFLPRVLTDSAPFPSATLSSTPSKRAEFRILPDLSSKKSHRQTKNCRLCSMHTGSFLYQADKKKKGRLFIYSSPALFKNPNRLQNPREA